MSRRPRKSRSELVKWLLAHQAVWDGQPARVAMKAMKDAGLFSERTRLSGTTLDKLILQARNIRRLADVKLETMNRLERDV